MMHLKRWMEAKNAGKCGACILKAMKEDAKEKKTSVVVTRDVLPGRYMLRFRNTRQNVVSVKLNAESTCTCGTGHTPSPQPPMPLAA